MEQKNILISIIQLFETIKGYILGAVDKDQTSVSSQITSLKLKRDDKVVVTQITTVAQS